MRDCEADFARAVVTVVSVRDEFALVKASGATSCGSCAGSGGCGTRTLMSILGEKTSILRVKNTVGARTGDRVEIEIEQSKILKMSALSYLLPLLGLIGGGAIGHSLPFGDGTAFAASMLGLVAGFTYSHHVYNSDRWESEIAPTCVRRLAKQGEQYINLEAIR